MISRYRISLSQRLLVGLILVGFTYSAGVAWFTIRDSVEAVYELFDVHLAQTALALLRVTDPDDPNLAMDTATRSKPALHEIFNAWPELPQRLRNSASGERSAGQVSTAVAGNLESMHAQYERNLRYQVLSGDGTLL
ncbi:MAG: hypothetical protein ACR2I0_09465, partial [Rhodoferax sp.]